jgi:serine/threonine protein kinase
MIGSRYCHFEIERLLGTGGMGEVYLAVDMNLERRVALKFLPRSLTSDPTAQGRLLDEARSCARLQHPNVAVIYSVEENGGVYAICMEYVEGRTVREILTSHRLEIPRLVEIALGTALGIAAAHEHGIIHRDIKPANVVITSRGQVKVMDFGLALRPRRTVETTGPESYGTVAYMSPEQARGDDLTASTDIFSFGSLLYQMATGHLPFIGDNDLSTLHAIISREPRPSRELRRDLPPGLDRLIMSCLAKDPAKRPKSMDEVVLVLRQLAGSTKRGPHDLISELTTGLETESLRRRHSRKIGPVSIGATSDEALESRSPKRKQSSRPTGLDACIGNTVVPDPKPPSTRSRTKPTVSVPPSASPRPVEPPPRPSSGTARAGTTSRHIESRQATGGVEESRTGRSSGIHRAEPMRRRARAHASRKVSRPSTRSARRKGQPPVRRKSLKKTLLGAGLALLLCAVLIFLLLHFVIKPSVSENGTQSTATEDTRQSVSIARQMDAGLPRTFPPLVENPVEPLPDMIELPLPPRG